MELSLVTSKKQRFEFDTCQHPRDDYPSSTDLPSPENSVVSLSSILPCSHLLSSCDVCKEQTPSLQQQPYHHPQRWWPKRFNLQKAYDSPHIYIIDSFLTTSQLEYLHQQIRRREQRIKEHQLPRPQQQRGNNNDNKDGWQRSFCDTDQGNIVTDDQHRTSSFLSLPKQSDKVIRDIERAAADLMGVHVHQVEALQLVRYRPGEFFGVHHDLGVLVLNESDEEHDAMNHASVLLPPKSIYGIPRRVATLFCYLNTLPPQCGGATYFPLCDGLQVQPKAGRAVLFCNITPEGLPEPKTIHAGQPVLTVLDDTATSYTASTTHPFDDDTNEKGRDATISCRPREVSTDPGPPTPLDLQSAAQLNGFDNVKYGLNIWACEGG